MDFDVFFYIKTLFRLFTRKYSPSGKENKGAGKYHDHLKQDVFGINDDFIAKSTFYTWVDDNPENTPSDIEAIIEKWINGEKVNHYKKLREEEIKSKFCEDFIMNMLLYNYNGQVIFVEDFPNNLIGNIYYSICKSPDNKWVSNFATRIAREDLLSQKFYNNEAEIAKYCIQIKNKAKIRLGLNPSELDNNIYIKASSEYYLKHLNQIKIDEILEDLLPSIANSIDSDINQVEGDKQYLLNYIINLSNESNVSKNILLIADGGMGKTTILYNTWGKLLSRKSERLVLPPIPFYVPLYDHDGSENYIEKYLVNHYFKVVGIKYEEFEKNIRDSDVGIVLLLDGFNETRSTSNLLREIDNLIQYNKISIVMTSRNNEELKKSRVTKEWIKLNLKPVDGKVIKDNIGQESFNNLSPVMKEILSNPMMLILYKETNLLQDKYNGQYTDSLREKFLYSSKMSGIINNYHLFMLAKSCEGLFDEALMNGYRFIYLLLIPYVARRMYYIDSRAITHDDFKDIFNSFFTNVTEREKAKFRWVMKNSYPCDIESVKDMFGGNNSASSKILSEIITKGLSFMVKDDDEGYRFKHDHMRDFYANYWFYMDLLFDRYKYKTDNSGKSIPDGMITLENIRIYSLYVYELKYEHGGTFFLDNCLDSLNGQVAGYVEMLYNFAFDSKVDLVFDTDLEFAGLMDSVFGDKEFSSKEMQDSLLYDILNSCRGNCNKNTLVVISNLIEYTLQRRKKELIGMDLSNLNLSLINLEKYVWGKRNANERSTSFNGSKIKIKTENLFDNSLKLRILFSNNDKYLIIIFPCRGVQIWDFDSKRCLSNFRLTDIPQLNIMVSHAAISDDNKKLLMFNYDGNVKVFDIEKEKEILEFGCCRDERHKYLESKGITAYTHTKFRNCSIITHTESENAENSFILNYYNGLLVNAVFCDNDSKIATITSGQSIKLWDAQTAEFIADMKMKSGGIEHFFYNSYDEEMFKFDEKTLPADLDIIDKLERNTRMLIDDYNNRKLNNGTDWIKFDYNEETFELGIYSEGNGKEDIIILNPYLHIYGCDFRNVELSEFERRMIIQYGGIVD